MFTAGTTLFHSLNAQFPEHCIDEKIFLTAMQTFVSRHDQTHASLIFWEETLMLIVSMFCIARLSIRSIEPLPAKDSAREAREAMLKQQHCRLVYESEQFQDVMQQLALCRDLVDLTGLLPGVISALDIK